MVLRCDAVAFQVVGVDNFRGAAFYQALRPPATTSVHKEVHNVNDLQRFKPRICGLLFYLYFETPLPDSNAEYLKYHMADVAVPLQLLEIYS